jgi:NADPH-dependent ferric siderophore reductase
MASGKGRLLGLLGGLVLTEAKVQAVGTPHPLYRRVVIEGEGLRTRSWQPGDKIQVLLPSNDVRTYTPIDWAEGRTTLLLHAHGSAPGARWTEAVRPGDVVRFVGPQRSLRLGGVGLLTGDETSLGVAASARRLGARAVLRVTNVPAAEAAARSLDVSVDLAGSDEEAAALLRERAAGVATAVACGGGAWIQRAREVLRAAGVREVRAKAYWIAGKTGID